jgi:hypothetical protein
MEAGDSDTSGARVRAPSDFYRGKLLTSVPMSPSVHGFKKPRPEGRGFFVRKVVGELANYEDNFSLTDI